MGKRADRAAKVLAKGMLDNSVPAKWTQEANMNKIAKEVIVNHQSKQVTIDGEAFPFHVTDQPRPRMEQGVVVVQLNVMAEHVTVITEMGARVHL